MRAERTGDTLHVTWNAFGRMVKKAELVSITSRDADWEKRPYEAKEIPFGDGRLECAIPPDTVLCWVNLTCDDGIVASSRNF